MDEDYRYYRRDAREFGVLTWRVCAVTGEVDLRAANGGWTFSSWPSEKLLLGSQMGIRQITEQEAKL